MASSSPSISPQLCSSAKMSSQMFATQARPSIPTATPVSSAFLPSFQRLCEEKIQTMEGVYDALEILQRRTILLEPSLSLTDLPGPSRDAAWRWRTKLLYQLNERQELEYTDKERKEPWRPVVVASDVFKQIAEAHCKAVMHAGMDKTEDYLNKRFKGIPRSAVRFVLKGCQACAKR